ncbi:protein borderless-like [Contarinia nasturtii]|uniref:protein borderless-like n=1 Tax=Contarinia nasturtii TaxID=265458 RepID=UPI0012D43CAD|nr:protein borderless-like [Contarinia nasturtii]
MRLQCSSFIFNVHSCSINLKSNSIQKYYISVQTERPVPLTSLPPPPTTTTLPISVMISSPEIQVGDTVRLPCSASDNITHTPTTVVWYKANGPLPDQSYQMNGVLTITNVQLTDAGEYICEAESNRNYQQRVTIMIKDNRFHQIEP